MLDLFRSRDTTMRYVLIVLLSLVALSMVITLIPTFGSGMMSSGRQDEVIADVCGDQVTRRMVAQVIQQQMRDRQFAPAMAEFMIPQIVNQFVGELATSCAARELKLSASDSEAAQYIQRTMPMLFQDGQFVGAEVYQSYLANMNTTIPEFEKRIRQQILLEKLQRVAFDGIVVTPKEVEAEFAKKGQKARIDVIKYDAQDYKKGINPTRADLEKYLKESQAQFQVPAKNTVALIVVDADKLGENIPVSEAQVNQLYDQNKERYRQEEKVRASHILIKAQETASKEDKAKAKAKAEEVLAKLKAGADFADMAKKNSEDSSNASKGGDLDWFERNRMVKPFEDAAYKLKQGELSGLVETVFGYHIIKSTGKQEARIKPLAEVKDELVSDFRKQQLFDRMPGLADQAQAELARAPGQAQAIAAKLGLVYAKAEKLAPGDPYPVVGSSSELGAAIASLQKGGVTPVVQTRDNKLIAAVLEDVLPARPAELADVEAKVRDGYIAKAATQAADQAAKTFEARLQANGGDFRKTAAELNLKVIDSGDFERGGQIKDVGPAGYFGEQPFINPVGTNVAIFRVGPMPYSWRIASRTQADMSKLEAERELLVGSLREKKLRERREMFEEGVVSHLKSSGKITVKEDQIKRLAQSYQNRG